SQTSSGRKPAWEAGPSRLTALPPLLPCPPGAAGPKAPPAFRLYTTFSTHQGTHADCQPTDSQGPRVQAREDEDPGAAGGTAEAGGLHARVHDDAQEAELGAAEDRA